eukprot:m.130406 g.130406  ORF g.130406 m.130406 type:complete len:1702 (-) comp9468_c0_seq9:1580-6685(-)
MVIGSVRLVVPLVVIIFAFIIASNSQMSFSINAQIHDECGFGFVNSGVVNTANGVATSLIYMCSSTSAQQEVACNVVNTANCVQEFCGSRCSCSNGDTIISCQDTIDTSALWPEGLPLSTTAFSWTKFATLEDQQQLQQQYILTPQHFRVGNDLTSISLHGTQLVRINPATPKAWRKLKELDVDSEPLDGFPWGELPNSLTKLKVTNTYIDGVFVSDAIANLTALEELHLDNNNLNQLRVVDVENLQLVSSRLTSLSASNNNLRSSYGVGFGYPNVRYMDLSNNQITSLTSSLTPSSRTEKLLSLDVSNNNIRFIPFGFFHHQIQDGDVSRVNFDSNPSQCRKSTVTLAGVDYTNIECSCELVTVGGALLTREKFPYCPPSVPITKICGVDQDISKLCNGVVDCPSSLDESAYICSKEVNTARIGPQYPPRCVEKALGAEDNKAIHASFYFLNGLFYIEIFDTNTTEVIAIGGFSIDTFGVKISTFSFQADGAGHMLGLKGFSSQPVLAKMSARIPYGLLRIYWNPDNTSDVCDLVFGNTTPRDEIIDERFDFPHAFFDNDPGVNGFASTQPFVSSSTSPDSSGSKSSNQGTIIGSALGVIVIILALGLFLVHRRLQHHGKSYQSEQTKRVLYIMDEKASTKFAAEYTKLYNSSSGVVSRMKNIIVPQEFIEVTNDAKQSNAILGSFGEIISKGIFSLNGSSSSKSKYVKTITLFQEKESPPQGEDRVNASNLKDDAPRQSKAQEVIVRILGKRDKAGTDTSDATLVQFLVFARVLVALSRHPNILKVEAMSIDSFPLKIATEYLDGGNLFDFLRTSREGASSSTLKPSVRSATKYKKAKFKNLANNLLLAVNDDEEELDGNHDEFSFDDADENDEVVADVLTKTKLLQVLHKVASAMTFVESKGVLHRNLSLTNIIVNKTMDDVRLTGFSLASSVYKSDLYLERQFLTSSDETSSLLLEVGNSSSKKNQWWRLGKKSPNKVNTTTSVHDRESISLMTNPMYRTGGDSFSADNSVASPLRYCAPEVLEDGDFSSKTDIYAFGVVMLETLLLGKPFLEGVVSQRLLDEILKRKGHVEEGGFVAAPEQRMIQQCLGLNPKSRPTFFKLHALLSYEISGPSGGNDSSSGSHDDDEGDIVDSNSHEPVFARSTSMVRHFSQDVLEHGRLGKVNIVDDAFVCEGRCRKTPLLFMVRNKNNADQLRCDRNILLSAGVAQILAPAVSGSMTLGVPQRGALAGLLFVPPRFSLMEGVGRVRKPAEISYTLTWLLDLCLALERMVVLRCNSAYLDEGRFMYVDEKKQRLCILCIPTVVLESDAFVIDYASASIRTFYSILNLISRALGTTSHNLGKRFESDVSEIRALDVNKEDARSLLCRVILLLKAKSAGGLEVSWNDLEFVKVLGSGQFGEVQLMRVKDTRTRRRGSKMEKGGARKLTSGLLVAVKTLLDPSCEGEFAKEMQLMTKIHHSNLLTLQHIITAETPKALVIEYLPNGSLDEWLKLPTSHPSLQDIIFILYQVACGCAELERIGIVHRDIAARNVLLGFNLEAKLSDYGLSRQMTTSGEDSSQYYNVSSAQSLPVRWMPPEVLVTRKFNVRSDVYAYGMLIFEVMSGGLLPFPDISDDKLVPFLHGVAKEVKADEGAWMNQPLLEAPSRANKALAHLFHSTTHARPHMRPSFSDVISQLSPHHFAEIQSEKIHDDEESHL